MGDLHAHERNKHRFQRYVRSNPLLCMHHLNAILLQHLRRNLNGSYHIRGTQPDHRKSKRKESQHTHVRTGSTVCIEICIFIKNWGRGFFKNNVIKLRILVV